MGQAARKICENTKANENRNNLPPYHVFKRLDTYFVFDTSTCRFYKIDEPTYEFLKLCLTCSLEEAEKKLLKKSKFSPETVKGISQEVMLLSKNGLFDVPDYSVSDEHIKKELNRAYATPIISVELALAETCNLACTYCYCGTSRNMPVNGLMSEKMAHQAVMWLFEAGGNSKKAGITLFGGEPLLNKPVIRSIVEYSQSLAKLHGKKVTYSMTTNATLLDDEFTEYVKNNNIDVMVSLDGPRKIHDAQCPTKDGKGSYNMATAGAKRLLSKRNASVRCTMTHPMPNLKELAEFFDDFGFKRAIIGPTINPIHSPSSVDFTKEDFAELARQEESLIPWMIEKIAAGEKLKYAPFDKFIGRISNCAPRKGIKKCGACHGCTFVASDGTIFPCHRFGGMKEWQIGHISNPPDYERYKKFWSDYRKTIASSCESCWAWPICKGPCPWELVRPDGTFEKSVRFCDFIKARVESAAYIYAWKQEHNIPDSAGKPLKNTMKNSGKNKQTKEISINKNKQTARGV